ncbi:MAG: hypothetical protein NC548_06390 [Lachnospiraceae bacterium]|nr:hypothetical protein [Lachnospiraceae bacterium]
MTAWSYKSAVNKNHTEVSLMPKVIIMPKLEVQKFSDDQGFIGTLKANMAYEVTLKPREGEDEARSVAFSIARIVEKKIAGEKTQLIVPNIMFFADGFLVNDANHPGAITEDDYIDVRDIQSLRPVYVNRRFKQSGRRKSTEKDPFVFTFLNPKDNKPFDVTVDHDHLVGVTVKLDEERKRTYIGFLDSMDKDEKISMSHLECYKGLFSVETVVFPATNVTGVFNYHLVIADYDEAMKAKSEARKADKKNKKKAAKEAKKNEPDTKEPVPTAEEAAAPAETE